MSAGGRRVGYIDSLIGSKDAPTAVRVVKDMAVVTINASTLAGGEKGRLVTSLALKDIY